MGNITILPRLFFLVFFFFSTCLFLNKACPLWFLLLDILKDVFVGSFPSCDRRISLSQFISGAYKCRRMTCGAKYSVFFYVVVPIGVRPEFAEKGTLLLHSLLSIFMFLCAHVHIQDIQHWRCYLFWLLRSTLLSCIVAIFLKDVVYNTSSKRKENISIKKKKIYKGVFQGAQNVVSINSDCCPS